MSKADIAGIYVTLPDLAGDEADCPRSPISALRSPNFDLRAFGAGTLPHVVAGDPPPQLDFIMLNGRFIEPPCLGAGLGPPTPHPLYGYDSATLSKANPGPVAAARSANRRSKIGVRRSACCAGVFERRRGIGTRHALNALLFAPCISTLSRKVFKLFKRMQGQFLTPESMARYACNTIITFILRLESHLEYTRRH